MDDSTLPYNTLHRHIAQSYVAILTYIEDVVWSCDTR